MKLGLETPDLWLMELVNKATRRGVLTHDLTRTAMVAWLKERVTPSMGRTTPPQASRNRHESIAGQMAEVMGGASSER